MDMDTISVHSQVAICAMAERDERKTIAALRPRTPTGPVNPSPPDSARHRASLSHFPLEIILRISEYLDPNDRARFGATGHLIHDPLKERLASDRYAHQADSITDLASLEQMLKAVEQDIRFEPSLRADPLQAFSKRLRHIPKSDRLEAFRKLFHAADAVPGYEDRLQALIIEQIEGCPIDARIGLFDYAFEMVAVQPAMRQEQQWAALATQIRNLPAVPQSLRSDRLDKVLNRMATLGDAGRASLIAALAAQLDCLVPGDRTEYWIETGSLTDPHGNSAGVRWAYAEPERVSEKYAQLQNWTERVPVTLRGKPRGALSAAIRLLPKDERPEKYEQGLRATLLLPQDQLGEALGGLLEGLSGLPDGQQANAFQRLAPIARRLSPSQTRPIAEGLMRAYPALEDQTQDEALQLILAMITTGPQEHHLWLLSNLMCLVTAAPVRGREDKFDDRLNVIVESLRNNGILPPMTHGRLAAPRSWSRALSRRRRIDLSAFWPSP